ncbi:hypothetical protein BV20DRAFT_955206 [Pilatotrama ljubarskyi]|nr:hypothetical protein BV20DRAFT_955206 [Pilatotrama ljubarskyi]
MFLALSLVCVAFRVLVGAKAAALTARITVSTCTLNCITNFGISDGCPEFTDLRCVCTNTLFLQAALDCIQSQCPAADAQETLQLFADECGSTSGE